MILVDPVDCLGRIYDVFMGNTNILYILDTQPPTLQSSIPTTRLKAPRTSFQDGHVSPMDGFQN